MLAPLTGLIRGTAITARAIAARSPPGVSDPARPTTMASAARAWPGSHNPVAAAMIPAFSRFTTPDKNAALVPGKPTSRSAATPSISSAAPDPMPSAGPSSRPANSSNPSGIPDAPSTPAPAAGRRRPTSASAACLRALA